MNDLKAARQVIAQLSPVIPLIFWNYIQGIIAECVKVDGTSPNFS
jgi:hypothetical protein